MVQVVDDQGRLDVDRLLGVLDDGYEVVLGELTEAELYWLGSTAGRDVPGTPDQASLRAMAADDLAAHLRDTAAALGESGELVVDDTRSPVRIGRRGARAMVAAMRETAAARTVVHTSQARELVAIAHHLPVGVDLVQEVHGPTHRFVARAPYAASAWVARRLDPDAHATVTSPVRRVRHRQDVDPPVDVLATQPHAHTLVRAPRTGARVRALEVVAGPDVGVVALQEFRDGTECEILTQALAPTDLAATCDAFLHAPIGPADRPVHGAPVSTR